MFRSCQIIIRELSSLLKLYYSIHNSIGICKRGVVAAYHVVQECVVEQCLGVRLILSHINPVHAFPTEFLKIHSNIILPSTCRSSKVSLSPLVSAPKPCVCAPSVPYTCHIPCPPHSLFDQPNNI